MSSQYANELGAFKCGRRTTRSGEGPGTTRGQVAVSEETEVSVRSRRGWSLVMGGLCFLFEHSPSDFSPLSHRLKMKPRVATNHSVLCPGQDIILYCKFIKETLQYRWCTIQGFIPPPAPSVHPQEAPLPALCWGGPSNRYHYWVSVMVRVPRLSLKVIGTGRKRKVLKRRTCGGIPNNKVCYSETNERLVSSIWRSVKVVLKLWLISLGVFKHQLACLKWWSLLHNGRL